MLCFSHFDSHKHIWFVFLRCTFPYILAKSDFRFRISSPAQMCPFPLISSYSTWRALLLHRVIVRNSKNTLLRGNWWLCNILKPFRLWGWTEVTFTDAHKVFLCRWGPFFDQVMEVWPEQARHRVFMSSSSCPFNALDGLEGLPRLQIEAFSPSPFGLYCGWSPGRWGIECLPLYPVVSETHFSSEILLVGGRGGWGCVVGAMRMAGKFSFALCCCDQGEVLSDLSRTSQWTLLVISHGSCSLGPLISYSWLGSCTPRHLLPTTPCGLIDPTSP